MRLTMFATALFVLFPLSAKSDDLLSCVDPEILRAFLWAESGPSLSISDQFPQEFSDISFPDDLRFIGSSARSTNISVAFHTDKEVSEAVVTMEDILRGRGWRAIPQRQRTRIGFQRASVETRQYLSLCHTDGQTMSVRAHNVRDSTYLVLSKSQAAEGRNCNRQTYPDNRMVWGYTDDLMPDLIVPKNARITGSGYGGMIMSSGDDADTHARIQTSSPAAQVIAHIAEQLVMQDWSPEMSWAGDISQGSTWMLEREDLPRTFGTLQLIKHDQSDYTLVFSMRAL